ncbi:hypothetical protein ACN28S_60420 [Cystobacter fuscus]
MSRYQKKSWVGSLLVGLLGVACGGAPETPPAPSPLPVAARESKLCAELGVSTLTLTGSNTQQGELAGSGSWAVSGPANGVRLEYYVDDVLYAVEEQPGKSGTWYFSRTGVSCGVLHPIQVKAGRCSSTAMGSAAPARLVRRRCPRRTWGRSAWATFPVSAAM